MSAARMAAEAAFAAPQFSLGPNFKAQITVRRARVPASAQPAAAEPSPPTDEPIGKRPRVFKVEAARDHHTLQAEPAPGTPVNLADHRQADTPKQRKRRPADHKRPGPVVLVHSPPPPLPFQLIQLIQPLQPSKPHKAAPRSEALLAGLEKITPTLAAIEQAQSYWFIDNRFDSHYQRLSKQADELLKQLRNRRR